MDKNDLTHLKQFCTTEDCGVPEVTPDGVVYRKHYMMFTGFTEDGHATYVCPGCSEVKKFKKSGEGFQQVQPAGCGMVLVAFVLVSGLVGLCQVLQ